MFTRKLTRTAKISVLKEATLGNNLHSRKPSHLVKPLVDAEYKAVIIRSQEDTYHTAAT